MITIRYYSVNNPGAKRTKTFDPAGTISLNEFHLAILANGTDIIRGDTMYNLLKDVMWPDKPFDQNIPVLVPPRENIWVPLQGDIPSHWEPNPDYLTELAAYAAGFTAFLNALKYHYEPCRLILIAKRVFTKVPDGPDIMWQYVDYTKPYSQRFSPPFPSEIGKYSGWYEWVEFTSPFPALWESFAKLILPKSGDAALNFMAYKI